MKGWIQAVVRVALAYALGLSLALVERCHGQEFISFYGVGSGGAGNGLLNGLVAYYQMDEGSGNALDATGGGRTLTENGSVGAGSGMISGERTFSGGSTNYFDRASEAAFTFGTNDFSVAFWVNLGAIDSGDHYLVGKSTFSPAAISWQILFDDGGTDPVKHSFWVLWSTNGSTYSQAIFQFSSEIASNTWYCVVARRDGAGGVMKITAGAAGSGAVDADVSGSLSASMPLFDNSSTPLRVGYTAGSGPFPSAKVDEVGLWSRALSDADVAALFNAGAGLPYSSFTH